MNPVDIKRRTRAIGAPANWNPSIHGSCGVLPVRDERDEKTGSNVMVSLFKPAPEELQHLNNGGVIKLRIYGDVHPVVSVGVAG